MQKKTIEDILLKIKEGIQHECKSKNWNNALSLINVASKILYYSNIIYTDEELEKSIAIIAKQKEVVDYKDLSHCNLDDQSVVFYDAFGLNSRGLAQIYLKALCKIKRVIYVTYKISEKRIPDLLNIINENNGIVYYLEPNNYVTQIKQLNNVLKAEKPKHFFFYAYPSDVVATTVMSAYAGIINRYQINLTDHAFWLGAQAIDVCIDFRNYGASISNEYRCISKGKIVLIPYYPIINTEISFQGFPFEVKTGQKVVFSGGSLYKTLGGDNKYYKIVDYMLSKYEDIIFWYAGEGDTTEIDKLIEAYPKRIYRTSERSDLYQVLEHCYFYLSTYPVCGGLMFQYVAKAGKIPLTLRYDNITDDFLLNQSDLDIQFDSIEDVYSKIDKLMLDSCYVNEQETRMKKAVISEEEFNVEVTKLFSSDRIQDVIKYEHIDTLSFRKEYLNNMTNKKLNMLIATKDSLCMFKYLPLRFINGIFHKVKNIVIRKLKNCINH